MVGGGRFSKSVFNQNLLWNQLVQIDFATLKDQTNITASNLFQHL